MHMSVPSAAMSLSDADFSWVEGKKYGRMEGSCVASTMVKMQAFARVMTTLFVRPQRVRRTGKKSGRRGSNPAPRPDARTPTRSMAAPESRVLSEFMAFVRGREIDRTIWIRSTVNSKAPLRHIAHKELMS